MREEGEHIEFGQTRPIIIDRNEVPLALLLCMGLVVSLLGHLVFASIPQASVGKYVVEKCPFLRLQSLPEVSRLAELPLKYFDLSRGQGLIISTLWLLMLLLSIF